MFSNDCPMSDSSPCRFFDIVFIPLNEWQLESGVIEEIPDQPRRAGEPFGVSYRADKKTQAKSDGEPIFSYAAD